jgi:hypothetical protein
MLINFSKKHCLIIQHVGYRNNQTACRTARAATAVSTSLTVHAVFVRRTKQARSLLITGIVTLKNSTHAITFHSGANTFCFLLKFTSYQTMS